MRRGPLGGFLGILIGKSVEAMARQPEYAGQVRATLAATDEIMAGAERDRLEKLATPTRS